MSRSLAAILVALIMEPAVVAQFTPSQPYPQSDYPQSSQPQYSQTPAPGEDQQQHGVARISIVQGDVNVKRGDNGELVAAAVNAPLVAHSRLQTSGGSRAEIELDSANLIRLAPNTDLGLADLEYRRYQVQLGAGTILYRVLRASDARAEVDTPSIAIRPATQGEYRISILNDGTTQITVRSGEVEIYGPRGSQHLNAGYTTLVRGEPSDPEFQTTYEIARDQFDDWSENRDRELLASQSYRYVSPDISGADDLDAYGRWVPSQFGQVWAPQPPVADWSPYSYGHWAWIDYYGWTWVDYAPWGWAPYHYGRWFWNGGYGWCWWPGARSAAFFWNPALVSFFGFGGAGLGWVALAPFEPFHPWWGRGLNLHSGYGFGRYDAFRTLRNAEIGRIYRNAAIRGGAITTSYSGFGRFGQRFSPATREQLFGANLIQGQVPVSPTRGSFQFANRQAMANPRLMSAGNRRFFQHMQSRPGAFSSVPAASVNGGIRFGANTVPSPHGTPPNVQSSLAGRGNYSGPGRSSSNSGWQRFGQPGLPSEFGQSFRGSEPSGWHRFGEPPLPARGGAYRGDYRGGQMQQPPAMSFGTPSYGGRSGFTAPSAPRYSAPATPPPPRYSAPATPRYSAPATPRYSAPSPHSRGSWSGGGSAHSGGGGGHSSSGGRRNR